MENARYWNALDELVSACTLVIDRPRGSRHPRYPDFIYPYDYGYLQGTRAMDQGGIDVWVGSLADRKATGIVCTVDLFKRDAEIKILLGCTPEESVTILKTHNEGPQSAILIPRPPGLHWHEDCNKDNQQ
jgi:inorganic pyrophosphatase